MVDSVSTVRRLEIDPRRNRPARQSQLAETFLQTRSRPRAVGGQLEKPSFNASVQPMP
jgi:hypothetical protein